MRFAFMVVIGRFMWTQKGFYVWRMHVSRKLGAARWCQWDRIKSKSKSKSKTD